MFLCDCRCLILFKRRPRAQMYVRTESRVLIEVSRMINSDNRSLI